MKRLFGIIAFAAILMLCMAASAENIDKTLAIVYQTEIDEEIIEEIPAYDANTNGPSKQLEISMPASIVRGESVTVTVKNPDGFTFKSPVFVDQNNEMIGWINLSTEYTAILPEYFFDVGVYSISLTAVDAETSTSVSVKKTLTVTGTNGAQGPTITANKTSAAINESITFTMSMPEAKRFASRVVTYVDGKGKSYASYYQINQANQAERSASGSYSNGTLVCFARAFINGAWTAESRCEVKIKEAPKLASPVVSAPSDVEVGKPFEIAISSVDHAEQYIVTIRMLQGFTIMCIQQPARIQSRRWPMWANISLTFTREPKGLKIPTL